MVSAISAAPYLYGLHLFPKPDHFVGFTYNMDDACVYLSWIKQARDGHFFIRNLFTTEPQRFLPFNLLTLVMGIFSRATSLSPVLTFHVWRIALFLVVLALLHRVCRALGKEELAPAAIWLASLSSGLGWALNFGQGINRPVDLWQPEAITFLSAYLNPLFLAGLALILWAYSALSRSLKTIGPRPVIEAGVALLLLANIHTYDLAAIGLAWAAFSLKTFLADRDEGLRAAKAGIVAAAISLPTVGYQAFLAVREPVYRLRAQTPAESPAIWFFLVGYGLVLVIALAGFLRRREPAASFLALWAIAGFAAAYLPFAQQRKLIMGTHLPLCILAAGWLAPVIEKMKIVRPRLTWTLIIVALMPSNLLFLKNDALKLRRNETAPNLPAGLSPDQSAVIRRLSQGPASEDVILAPPDLAVFIPALAGRRVYCGHWSETVDYGRKLNEWLRFADVSTTDTWRREFLAEAGITIVIQSASVARVGSRALGGPLGREIGRQVIRAGSLVVYRAPASIVEPRYPARP